MPSLLKRFPSVPTLPELMDYLESREVSALLFCFRWLLVNFKREFELDDLFPIWEALLSQAYSGHYHLFVCAAILHNHSALILDTKPEFDELIQMMNDLSGRISWEQTLVTADALCVVRLSPAADCFASIPAPLLLSLPFNPSLAHRNHTHADTIGWPTARIDQNH